MNIEKIVNQLYAADGTDSGILFGIKEREVVKAIVEMTVRRVEQKNDALIKCLHDLRNGIFKDADAVNKLIDKTLADYETSLVEQTDKTI